MKLDAASSVCRLQALNAPRKRLLVRLGSYSLLLRAAFNPALRVNRAVEWMFVLTLPNAGSTALADMLASASRAVTLTKRAEGQWLVPGMAEPKRRWDPNFHPNYALVRAVWLDRLTQIHPGSSVLVIEKSPPNLCRHEALIDAFRAMKTHVMTYCRNPYATCASWHARYGLKGIAQDWGFDRGPENEAAYFEALGRIWGVRAAMLDRARRTYNLHVCYEELCANPSATLKKIAASIPMLADADATAVVRVKDHEAQPLRDMNKRQIAVLTRDQIAAITHGLAPYSATVEALGYEMR